MSFTKVDLPEPLTPVTGTNSPSGNWTSIPFKLFSFASLTVSTRFGSTGRRFFGVVISLLPEIYAPVIDFLELMSSSRFPETTISPPCSPAPGPISTIQSEVLIVSSSCSTTISVFPSHDKALVKVSINLRLSR